MTRARLQKPKGFGKGFDQVDVEVLQPEPSLLSDSAVIASRVPRHQVKVGSLISDGAYGEIYWGTYNREAVAIKTMSLETRNDPQKADIFLAEVKVMADLTHPHIVQYVGVSWTSLADLCVLTELMKGGDLRTMLKHLDSEGHPQGINYDKLRIAYHVAQALTYLHSFHPVRLHRNLKSRNVLLTENLDAKLADFGLSRELEHCEMTAGLGTALGMAPEVMMGERYDEKIDIFSFGVVLSELDLQSLPYARARADLTSEWKVLEKVMFGKLQVEFSPGCLASVAKLGKECVALDPSSRPSAPVVAYRLQTIMKNAFGKSN